ncbi:MAG: ArnT family glycosyltransferase [Fimbriimonas sp.]
MLGVLITLLVCVGVAGWGRVLLFRGNVALDPAAGWGVSGLLGLGALGMVTLGIGLVPGGLSGWGIFVVGVLTLIGCAVLVGELERPILQMPKGTLAIAPLVIGIAALFALVSVLTPSDPMDWDMLAYHLAVPKLWIQAGRIEYITYIHHSNFPFTVDLLYVWGLRWGGEAGAKAFQLGYFLSGILLIFGLARQRYGERAGWWAAVAFATVPVVLWETGSGYIDVAHGLYAGGGILLAALAASDPEKRRLIVPAGLLLGFAAGSKYTGLQTIAAVGFVLLLAGAAQRRVGEGFRQAFVVGGLALAVASPWFIKNVINTGNPVYPFFYERLGGRDWDQRRADIYRNEQQTFGVGRVAERRDPTALGHAVLGLAYQPGRYVNPGQTQGAGTPLGAVGLAVLTGLILWPLAGRVGRFEAVTLGSVAISLGMWFFLSQQSRYIVPLAVPLAVLVGGATALRGFGAIAMGAIGIQSAYTLWLFQKQQVVPKVRVAMGQEDPEAYRKAAIPFYTPAQTINREVKGGKVALYDELFGYLLDVPYFWANPSHTTFIPYDDMKSGEEYVRKMRELGFTHVYISYSPIVKEPGFARRWLGSMGLGDPSTTFPEDERRALMENWETKFHVLIADAVRDARLTPVETFRSGILFKIAE